MDSLANTQKAIEFLKNKELGKVNFLPLELFSEIPPDSLSSGEEGLLGVVSDFLRCRPEYRSLITGLLREVSFTPDLESGLKILKEGKGKKIVTQSGEVLETPGLIKGGGKERGILASKERIEQLGREIEDLKIQMAKNSFKKEEVENRRARIKSELELSIKNLNQEKLFLIEQEKKLSRITFEQENLEAKLSSLQSEIERFQNEVVEIFAEIEKRKEALLLQMKEKEMAEKTIKETETILVELEDKSGVLAKKVQDKRICLTELRGTLETLRKEMERTKLQTEETIQFLEKKRGSQSTSEKMSLELQEKIEECEAEVGRLSQQKSMQMGKRGTLQMESTGILHELQEVETGSSEIRQSMDKTKEEFHRLQMRLSELSFQKKNLKERIFEAYEIDLETLEKEEKKEIALEEMRSRVEDLKQKVKRLGLVNLLALKEYKEEEQRHNFLLSQQKDLLAAKEDLKTTIKKIDEIARKMFCEKFESIRQGFIQIFSRLFPGGEADLQLVGDDPLQAEILILARPEGKKLRSIDLLSGGERALTAIALLFGIYLTKPAPFCILDEIDAPLDDSNVAKFIALLKEFSQKTQFAVITHNKKTMEIADCLYGITMEEPGVSKVISMKFNNRKA